MNNTQTVLVVNGSGLVGRAACLALLERGLRVRALVRPKSRSKLEELLARGVELAFGDLRDPDSLRLACAGVSAVISTATAVVSQEPGDSIESVDRFGQLNLIAAAEASSAEHFVFVSFPEQAEDFPLQAAKRAVEQRLSSSSLAYTILRPAVFQEVWLSPALGFDYVEGRARIFGDGHGRMHWVSAVDVAEVAAECILAEGARGKVLEFGGPHPLSMNEVVSIFERHTGRSFEKDVVPADFLHAQVAEANDPRQKSFFALALVATRGYAPRDDLKALGLPQPRATVEEYAAAAQRGSGRFKLDR